MFRRTLATLLGAALAMTGLTAATTSAQAATTNGSIAVRVLTQHDGVVRQSYVDLRAADSDTVVSSTKVGSGGWTRHVDIAPGAYRLVIRDAIGSEAERTANVSLAAGEAATVTMRIAAAQTVSGRVTLAGKPVPGVAVDSRVSTTSYGPSTRTGSDGSYTLVVPTGKFYLRAGAGAVDGVKTRVTFSGGVTTESKAATFTVAPGAHTSQDIAAVRAAPTSQIAGRLVDSRGRALAGVTVFASPHPSTGARERTATSGTDGTFSIEVPAAGRYALEFRGRSAEITGPEYVTVVKTAKVGKGKRLDVGRITLKRSASWGTSTVQVRFSGVTASEDDPTYVYLKNSRGTYVGQSVLYDDIDKVTTANFSDIAAGRYRAYVPATGQSVAVTVREGATVTRTLALKKPAKRGAVVVKLGRGVSAGWLTVRNSAGLQVSRQHYDESRRFANLPAGRYTVSAAGKRGEIVATFTIRHGRTTTVTLASTGGTVTGKVKAGSKGYAATVILKRVGSSTRYEVQTDKAGKFVLGEVAPGRYRVVARDGMRLKFTVGGYKDAYYQGKTLSSSRTITVKNGKTTRLSAVVFR